MATQPGIEEILAKVRERVQARRPQPATAPSTFKSGSGASSDANMGELRRNLYDCNALYNAVGKLNPRVPGLLSRIIQFVKKLMRRALTWYTRPLLQFHGSVTRTLNETAKILEELEVVATANKAGIQKQQDAIEGLTRQTEQIRQELQEALTDSQNRLQAVERELRRLARALEANSQSAPPDVSNE